MHDGKLHRPISIVRDLNLVRDIPLEDVRNFCFIAHIDHGKSSLASRVLELTGNLGIAQQWTGIKHAKMSDKYHFNEDDLAIHQEDEVKNESKREQIDLLDTLNVEKQRGITVKASAASMLYPHPSAKGPHGVLLLNMVDTPGHVDFGTEVTRTLSSVQGAVLLFDAVQGPQAQSLSVHEKAKQMSNVQAIIPVLTKVDLPNSRSLDVTLSVSELFGFDPDGVLLTSARSRIGVGNVIEQVCQLIPPPNYLADDDGKTLRAQVVDSWFEPLRGVVCLVQVLSGELKVSRKSTIIDELNHNISHF
jgi:GTP-binding protein LepA